MILSETVRHIYKCTQTRIQLGGSVGGQIGIISGVRVVQWGIDASTAARHVHSKFRGGRTYWKLNELLLDVALIRK